LNAAKFTGVELDKLIAEFILTEGLGFVKFATVKEPSLGGEYDCMKRPSSDINNGLSKLKTGTTPPCFHLLLTKFKFLFPQLLIIHTANP